MKFEIHNILIKGLGICLLSLIIPFQLVGQCAMGCINNENISLDLNCEALISPAMILRGTTTCTGPFTVNLFDADGLAIPTSPMVNHNQIGQTLTVQVQDQSSNNYCWGTIFIEDKLPPTITCRDTTLPCFASFDNIRPITTDACGSVQLSFVDNITEGTCTDTFTQQINRLWTATDNSNNTAQCLMMITLERLPLDSILLPPNFDDTDAPALLCDAKEKDPGANLIDSIGWNALPNGHPSPHNEYYPAPNDDRVKWFGTGLPSRGCTGSSYTYTDQRINICSDTNSDACFKIVRTWTIIDHCGGDPRTEQQLIKVLDKEAPIISGLQDVHISTDPHRCLTNWNASVPTLNDNCQAANALTYEIIYSSAGTISGSALNGYLISDLPIGTHQLIYQSADCCGNTSLDTMEIRVDDQIKPTPVCDEHTQASINIDGTSKVFATSFDDGSHDNCGAVWFKVIRQEELLNTISGSTDGQNGLCDGLNGDDDALLPGRQIYFDDFVRFCCADSDTDQVVIFRVFDKDPGSGAIAPARMQAGGDLFDHFNDCEAQVELVDKKPPVIVCPNPVVLNCTEDPLDLNLTGRPRTYDNCGLDSVFFTDRNNLNDCQVGTISRTWVARDLGGRESSCTQQITLVDNTPPVIQFPNDTVVSCGASMDPVVTGRPTAYDDCSDLYIGHEDLLFEFPDSCTRKVLRTWIVRDWCTDIVYSQRQVIKEFDDLPPMLNVPPDTLINCESVPLDPIGSGLVTATDNCDGKVDITFTQTRIDGACPDQYTLIRIFTAVDNCDNDTSIQQTLTVIDTTGPVFQNVPSDIILSCEAATPPIIDPSISDLCDPFPVLDFRERPVERDCKDNLSLIRIWTATDRCGNTSTVSQQIIFEDTTAPVFSNVPMNMILECDDPIPNSATPIASDNCDPSPQVDMAETRIDGACSDEFTLRRSWLATDRCGNSTSIVQLIRFEDNTPPILLNIPPDATVECMDTSTPMVTATDNCDTDVTISRTDSGNGPCNGNNTRILTWMATDNCGNTATASQVITLEDTTPPTLSNVPADVTVDCNAIPMRVDPIAMDTCSGVQLRFEEQRRPGNCPDDEIILRIWTAEDGCGNTTIDSQRISVIDSIPPVLSGIPNDTIVDCNRIPSPSPISPVGIRATDNCDDQPMIEFSESRLPGICPQEGNLIRMWIAIDACGNRDTASQTIQLIDSIAPSLVGIPVNAQVECDDIPAPPIIGQIILANDNCDANPAIILQADTTAGLCPQTFTITRTWTTTDACGNQNSATQIIEVEDTEAPQISGVPADISTGCDNVPPPPANNNGISATDNCDPMPLLSFAEDTIRTTCLNQFTLERKWTATDACGNKDSVIQQIFVGDILPPVIDGVPNDTTVLCDQVPSVPVLGIDITATDNCMGLADLSYEQDSMPGACPNEYLLTRRWIAEDLCGNKDTSSQLITVIDTIAPMLSGIPTDVTVECDAIPSPPIIGQIILANDNCDADPAISLQADTTAGVCPQTFTITRTWTTTDACGNQNSATQIIEVEDTEAPQISGVPADISTGCDNVPPPPPNNNGISATDNCDPMPLLSFAEDTIRTTCLNQFTLERKWTATDACGNKDSVIQQIFVGDILPPVIDGVPNDTTVLCDQVPSVPVLGTDITATDNCMGLADLSYEQDSLAGDCPNEYLLTRRWIAEDLCGNKDTSSQLITVIDTIAPMLSGIPMDVTVECDAIPSPPIIGQTILANDNCDADPAITLQADTTAGICPQTFTITRTWTTTDACGNQNSATQIIEVEDTEAPQISGVPADISTGCDNVPPPPPNNIGISATDNCDPMPLLSFAEDTIRTTCINQFTLERKWTATDACGNKDSVIQQIFVGDILPPVIDGVPNDTTVLCDQVPSVPVLGTDITAIDNCMGLADLNYEQDSMPGACPNEYLLTRRWIAEDLCGNKDTSSQLITVIDTIAPMLSGIPTDVTVECDAIPSPPIIGQTILANDNCDADPAITLQADTTAGICPQTFTITRTWTTTDACGNQNSATQIIEVEDTEAPQISGVPADISTGCDNVPPPPANNNGISATDNCDPMPMLSFAEDTIRTTCLNQFTLERKWTATDACGNKDSVIQQIFVGDILPPVIDGVPNDTTVLCDQVPSVSVLGTDITATDNCMGLVDLRYEQDSMPGACPNEYLLTRRWIAEDLCGNKDTSSQLITVIDTIAPTINEVPEDTTVSCDAVPNPPIIGVDITATDNCPGLVVIRFFADTIAGRCTNEFAIQRNWIAEDVCGNLDTATQVLSVIDLIAPILAGIPNDTSVICSGVPVLPIIGTDITATDNCAGMPNIIFFADTLSGNCLDEMTILRNWVGEDACGNRDTATQTIFVIDTIAPVLSGIPNDTTVLCSAIPPAAVIGTTITATDNCGGQPSIQLIADTLAGNCPQEFTILRSWVAEDACGNRDSVVQQLLVIDTIAPMFSGIPADTTVVCFDVPDFPPAGQGITATDNCDPMPVILTMADTLMGACANEFTIRRFWIAVDACGNRDTAIQRLSVGDAIPPVLSGIPSDTTVDCHLIPMPPVIGVDIIGTDDCGDDVQIELVPDTIPGICANQFTLLRNWVAEDPCGNRDTFTQRIEVIDTIAPLLTVPLPINARIENGDSCDVFVPFMASARDSCDAAVQITHNFAGALNPNSTNGDASGDYPLGLTTVIFTATDACGNTTTDSSLVEIVDRFGPTFTCGDLSITLDTITKTDTVRPEQIMTSSIDLCSNPTTRFFIQTVDPTQIVFDCNDPASTFVFIETADSVGNSLICGARVNITNRAQVCGMGPTPISGNIIGQLANEEGEGMADVSIRLSGAREVEVKSGTAGYFELTDLPKGASYEVGPYDNRDPLNGISTYDLVLISKHILGIEALESPYKLLAADVNESGSITASDMLALRKMILYIDTAFQQTTSWKFLQSDFIFTQPENPFDQVFPETYFIDSLDELVSDANFMGIKMGDVNGSARPFGFVEEAEERTTQAPLNLSMEQQELKAGQNYRIPVSVSNFKDILGFQFNLEAKPEQLNIEAIEMADAAKSIALTKQQFGQRLFKQGVLTASWYQDQAVELEDGQVLFYLIVEAKADGFLDQMIQIGQQYTKAEAYSGSLEQLALNLTFTQPTTASHSMLPYQLLQNRPNPFSNATTIGFYLPQLTDARLSIFDVAGRLVKTVEKTQVKGYQEVNIQAGELSTSSIYYYQLQTPSFTATRKMLLHR